MSLAQLLAAHGDPVLSAKALGQPVPVVAPAAVAPLAPAPSPIAVTPVAIAPVPLNVDRIPTAATTSPAIAPAPKSASVAAAAAPSMPAASTWLDWVKAHALWLLVALLIVLLLIAYARRSSRPRESGFRPSRMVKGSPEARAHMANLRARKGKG